MSQARARVGRRQSGAQPGGGDAEVRHRPRQVVDVDLEHAPHDEGVRLGQRHFVARVGQETKRGQSLRAAPGRGERVGLRRARQGPQGRTGRGCPHCPVRPGQRLRGATGQHHPVGQGCRRARANFTFGLRIVRPPRGEQATLGTGRAGEHPKQPGQGIATGAGVLAGSQDPRRRRGIGRVQQDDGGVEQAVFPVLGGAGKGGRLLQGPRRGAGVARGGGGPGGRLELTGQGVIGTQRRRRPVGQPGAAGHDLGRPAMQFPANSRTQIGVDRRPIQRVGEGQLKRRRRFGYEPGGDRRIDLPLRAGQPGDGRDRRNRRVLAKHRGRRQE
jgi:hypothetical protein